MLSYFAASGHSLYCKLAYLYLQTVSKLEETHPNVYQMFTNGYHVVRRSERFWAGLSTDLVIEQVLRRSSKTTGGMTRGRGMTDLQRSVWLLSTPACAEINRSMQEVTGIKYETSDQHKEKTQARHIKDLEDSVNIIKYMFVRNPFHNQKELTSIDTGEVAIPAVNVDTAHAVGMSIITSMTGKAVTEYTFKKKRHSINNESTIYC